LFLCPQPCLTRRTVDDHRQLPARYGAMGSALRGRLAAVLLHHVGGHNTRHPKLLQPVVLFYKNPKNIALPTPDMSCARDTLPHYRYLI